MRDSLNSNASCVDRVFTGIEQRQTELVASEFVECQFVRCLFPEAIFRECRFVTCIFSECDLSLARLPGTTVSGAVFRACKIVGVNWAEAIWPEFRIGPSIRFSNCRLDHSVFIGLPLREAHFRDCVATGVDYREADLSGAVFAGTDLSESLFMDTNLAGADFRTARNYHIVPGENRLAGARFALPEALSLLYNLEIELEEGP